MKNGTTVEGNSQQGQSVIAVGSQLLSKKESQPHMKQISQPILSKHKSKSILSELHHQINEQPHRDKLMLNQLESPYRVVNSP